jgi:hypothetical protein
LKTPKEDITKLFASESSNRQGSCKVFFTVSDEEKANFEYIEWVVMRDIPIAEVENPLTRNVLRFEKKLCAKTIRKYILATAKTLKESLKKEILPDQVVGIFDGWTEGSSHYIGFAVAYLDGKGEYNEILLSMKPILKEGTDDLSAASHAKHIESVLEEYGKTTDSLLALVGDNCTVNRRLCSDLNIPLIGCAAHKFNLAVNCWIDAQGPEKYLRSTINALRTLVTKASTIKNAAQLMKTTELRPVLSNVTRWSSCYEMIERYLRIQVDLERVEALGQYMLSTPQNLALKDAVKHLRAFDATGKHLQQKGLSFIEARSTFDYILTKYPVMSTHLGREAKIIHDKVFERALLKIHNDNPLDQEEARSVEHLLRDKSPGSGTRLSDDTDGASDLLDLEHLHKRLKSIGSQTSRLTSKYVDLKVISGTSVSLERAFSVAKFILTDTRKRTKPELFEALLFLKLNHGHWDAKLVSRAVNALKSNSSAAVAARIVETITVEESEYELSESEMYEDADLMVSDD